MANNQNGELVKVKIGALWERQTKTGEIFLAGRLNQSAQILVFRNGYKKKPSDPDWIPFLAPNQPAPERAEGSSSEYAGGAHGSGQAE